MNPFRPKCSILFLFSPILLMSLVFCNTYSYGQANQVQKNQDPNIALANKTTSTDDDYIYDPTGRLDPFVPPWLRGKEFKKRNPILLQSQKSSSEPTETIEQPSVQPPEITDPILKFDLHQYTILAILWNVQNPRAMIKDPSGKVHTLQKNSKIGKNNGFVSLIREGEVVVFERNPQGNMVAKVMEIKK